MTVPTKDKIYTHIQLSWPKDSMCRYFCFFFLVRRIEKKKIKIKEWKENSVRTQKETWGGLKGRVPNLHSEKMSKPRWHSVARCLYWWPQACVSPGCLATFLPVWMEGCPPTNQTFSLWELSELLGQANFTHKYLLSFHVTTSSLGIFFSYRLIALCMYNFLFS